MIKISIFYPNHAGSRFDMAYYIGTHMPRAIERLSGHPGYKGVAVDEGLASLEPEGQAKYAAICHFMFDAVDDFMAAFMPHAELLQNDIPNYTDIVPAIEVYEVALAE